MHRISDGVDTDAGKQCLRGVNQNAMIDKKAVESLCLKGYRGLTVCVLWSKFKVVKEV